MATANDDSKTISLKIPPHSIEAERSVLGGLMLDEDAWDAVAGIVTPEDFYLNHHRIIFRCMGDLTEKNKPLDIVTISESLDSLNELDGVGGLAYLSDLASGTPTASNIKAYADIVSERATVRHLISVAHDIAESGFNPLGRNSHELIDMAESEVFKIG
ncbi:MAG: replicative DNA helicase, partial [Candidatus Azotimanducaceae bacterium]